MKEMKEIQDQGEFTVIDNQGPHTLDCEALQDTIEGIGQGIVIFGSPMCGPCHEYIEAISEMGDLPEVDFIAVDVDSCPVVASSFSIDETPTILVKLEGKVSTVPLSGDIQGDITTLKQYFQKKET